MSSFDYAEPSSLDEAFRLLDPDDSAVRPVGGCTALMLMMKARVYKPTFLVSLRRIGGALSSVTYDEDAQLFRIGAMATFSQIERSPDIRARLPVIAQTMKTLANVRVRNVATVGGNLAHGDPHLDLPPVWMALGAQVKVASQRGERMLPVDDLFAGYYETTLLNDELITELQVPVKPGWRSSYSKITTRSAHDWPALGLSLCARTSGRDMEDLKFVLSAAVDQPTRLTPVENVLRGAEIDDAVLERAADAATEEVELISDSRGSADYKQQLLRVHVKRAVKTLVGME